MSGGAQSALETGAGDVQRETPGNRVVGVEPLGNGPIGLRERLQVDAAFFGDDDAEGALRELDVVEIQSQGGKQ